MKIKYRNISEDKVLGKFRHVRRLLSASTYHIRGIGYPETHRDNEGHRHKHKHSHGIHILNFRSVYSYNSATVR